MTAAEKKAKAAKEAAAAKAEKEVKPELTPEEKVKAAEAAEAAELEKAAKAEAAEQEAANKEQPKNATEISRIQKAPEEVVVGDETVLIFKAKRPLTTRAFKAAAEMLRTEQEATGLKIVLMPYSAELAE